MIPIEFNDFDDLFVLGFYIITTIMQLYFLWNISKSLKRVKS
ncbi:hypothetical protein Ga0466249_002500 [Sporomusaceae bacterium BoRhaA]|jgi:hypothetical protein|nr:hypothetical protein [Pelorhabdus rhamnosifermentans]